MTVGRPVNVGVEETLASAAPGCFMIFVVRPQTWRSVAKSEAEAWLIFGDPV
jgi:hypothetical protein